MPENIDGELQAMDTIMSSLSSLDTDAQNRVIEYVLKRLKIQSSITTDTTLSPTPPPNLTHETVPSRNYRGLDIRTLKEEKQPSSANQMAALVAYYLSEVAGPNERKDTINASDINKYFKQAGFDLPAAARFTLMNARNAGYLESSGVTGEYKLNPVGYNLVTKLPAGSKGAPKKAKPKTARRRVKRAKPKRK